MIYLGFDPREMDAFAVAWRSILRHNPKLAVTPLVLNALRETGLYWRRTERRDGKLWDCISEAPMSTEFAISRFLVPAIHKHGWALFLDCDVMAMCDLGALFAIARKFDDKALLCVQHDHRPANVIKMDGQAQTSYARKNWSSVMMINCSHSANARLTVKMVNSLPGRDLHRFCWLEDDEIGALGPGWNYLVGHSDPHVTPKIVHFTDGVPSMPGYESAEYAIEWREMQRGLW